MFKYYNLNTNLNIFNNIHYSNENGEQQTPEDILFIRPEKINQKINTSQKANRGR